MLFFTCIVMTLDDDLRTFYKIHGEEYLAVEQFSTFTYCATVNNLYVIIHPTTSSDDTAKITEFCQDNMTVLNRLNNFHLKIASHQDEHDDAIDTIIRAINMLNDVDMMLQHHI